MSRFSPRIWLAFALAVAATLVPGASQGPTAQPTPGAGRHTRIDRYGDPRDPKVDAVDWVELIPFAETRNYVQRIMENLQVYRARFGGGTRLQIEADLHRGSVE